MGQMKRFAYDAEEVGVDPNLALTFWKSGMTADDAIQKAIDVTPEAERLQNLEDFSGLRWQEAIDRATPAETPHTNPSYQ